jgi:RHS repeat-associated protein
VEFFLGSTLIGTGSSGSPSHFVWNNVHSGSYSLTAKATAVKKNRPNVTAISSPVNIMVNAHPVVALTSPAASGTEYSIPPPTVTVGATATDSDGTIAKVEFYSCFETGDLITTITTPPYTFQWTLPIPYWQPGYFRLYGIRAEVVDNLGARGVSKCPLITVAPTVTLTSPADGGTYAAPATIALNAAVNPADGPVKVKFYNGNALIGEDLTAPFSFSWENVGAGTYALTAVVAESEGWREWSSAPVNVTVTAVSAQSKLHFIHVDHLNTPRLVADATGTTVWLWHQAEPFGDNVPDENPSGLGVFDLPLRLPGQYFDKETNLHYNHFRDYDPSIGRYEESDPVGLRGGLNTYAYVNAPLMETDPLGLMGRPGFPSRPGSGVIKKTSVCGTGALTGPEFQFYDACVQHDKCFETCGRPKAECDDEFCRQAKASCPPGDFVCGGAASFYCSVLQSTPAGVAYNPAQRAACQGAVCKPN